MEENDATVPGSAPPEEEQALPADKWLVSEAADAEKPDASRHAGIGGWLILPAIGLVVTLVALPISIVKAFRSMSDASVLGSGGPLEILFFGHLGLLLVAVYATVCFFKKRRNAPAVMIWLYVSQVLLVAVTYLAVWRATGLEPGSGVGKGMFMCVIKSAVWISYSLVSKRVKATFVN